MADLLTAMPGCAVEPARLRIRTDQVGAGYGTLTPAAAEALILAACAEGIVLDPIYTARALAGLRAAIADGDVRRGQPVVFVHSGGLPSVFGHAAAVDLGNSGLGRCTS